MKLFALFILPVLALHGPAISQYDSLLHRPYPEKVEGLNRLYADLVSLEDTAATGRKAEEIRRMAAAAGDLDMEMEMELFNAYYGAFFLQHDADRSVAALQTVIARSQQAGIHHIRVRALRMLSQYYWHNLKDYELAFEQYLRISKELSSLTPEEYPDMAHDLLRIADAYYFFQDYGEAKKFLERIIVLPETEFNTRFVNSARNTLGLCYQKENRLDEADFYFREVSKSPFPHSKVVWERIANGNIGTSHYLRKEFEKAIPLLVDDYIGAEADNDFGPAAGAQIRLADIALEQANVLLSWEYITRARENISKSGQKERLRYLFPVINKWYSVKGHAGLTKLYLDSTIAATKEYHERFSALKILRAQQKIHLQEVELKQAEHKLKEQQKTNERNILAVVLTCLCLLLAAGYYLQQKRQQARDLKLRTATRELDEFARSISEKNKLIEKLQNHHSEEERHALIRELQKSTILTEEDWVNFQRLFKKVHPVFFSRLKEKIPLATPAETRVLALARLNLNTREMAGILGVGTDTIRQHRSRIRRKLGLSDETDLGTLIAGL